MTNRKRSKVFGYCRISTVKQSIERQIRNIKALYPDAVIVTEAYTGTTIERPEWQKLVRQLKAGDTVVFDSVSRMSRNAEEGFQLYEALFQKGVNLVFLKEPQIDSRTYKEAMQGRLDEIQTGDQATDGLLNGIIKALNDYMLALAKKQIQLAFEQAEKEVQDLRQRTSEGIETARLAGKQIGQKPGAKLHVKKAEAAKKLILKHSVTFGGSLEDADCMKLCGISRNSYYKYKRELKEER